MARIANPFRISYRGEYKSVMCVYKIWVGNKYFIGSAKALKQHIEQLSIGIDRQLRNGIKPDNLYYDLIIEIQKTNVQVVEAEVIYTAISGYSMLRSCYNELQICKNDSNCLNNTYHPYIPGWVSFKDKEEYTDFINNISNK